MVVSDSSDGFFKQFSQERAESYRIESFEETCVKKLLTKSGVVMRLAAWKAERKKTQLTSRLTLEWMQDTWARFPLTLAIGSHQYPGKLPYAALLGCKISKLAVFKDYQELASQYDIHPAQTRFGMMFKCQRAKHATIQVLHNQPNQSSVTDFDVEDDEGRHCRRFMFRYRGVNYVIEGIDSFIATIGTDWATDD